MPATGTISVTPEADLPSPASHESGASLVSRRAIAQIVRTAVSGSYGVTGLVDDGLLNGSLVRLGLRPPAILVRLHDGIRVGGLRFEAAPMPRPVEPPIAGTDPPSSSEPIPADAGASGSDAA